MNNCRKNEITVFRYWNKKARGEPGFKKQLT